MNIDPTVAARLYNVYWSLATIAFIAAGSVALGRLASFTTRWRGGTPALQRRAFWGYAFAAPWILGFVIFVVGPAAASLFYSFTDYQLGRPLEWIGWENYRILIDGAGAHGRRFTQAMFNSFYYALVGVPLQIATALGMALLVSRPLPGIGLFRLIFYLPVILAGGPAILLAWRYMLASNGGFVNLSLQRVAESLPLFGVLYRGFIYLVEGFNSFYSGVARGDPVGAFVYTPAALLGAGLCAYLISGPWDAAKRETATRTVEVIGIVLAVSLLGRGLVADPIDPATWLGLLLVVTLIVFTLTTRRLAGSRMSTGVARGLAVAAVGFAAALLARLLWLEQGSFGSLASLLLLRSPLELPEDLEYLRVAFPASLPAAGWIWALLAAVAAGSLLPALTARGRGLLLGASGLALALLAVGSMLDGARYFAAFTAISVETGATTHHFALFRQVTAGFPELNRVPLWLQSELWSKPSLVLITMWSSGTGMLIFLAALKGVPRALYEAAEVDGAGPFQRFFRITLPMISPAMFYNVVIGLIAALQTFEAVYIIQTTQTESSLASAAYFLYVRTFRQLEIGQGSAASWILAVIIVILTVFQFRYSRWVHYEG
ncbi:MAG: sugar ABC transporter permease [Trueperaceae bacterium]